jgi:hypothetical protein
MTVLARGASLALAFGVAVMACTNDGSPEECSCDDSALTITIPADLALSVTGVQLSGTACTGVNAVCTNQGAAPCLQYRVEANAAGTCNVEVDSANGAFPAEVTITQTTGCCAGFYATPESAASIVVPESDGGGG